MKAGSIFEVDREGLAKIAERRGKSFIIHELLQNAWDTRATQVNVTLREIAGRPLANLEVQDDHPDGFTDLTHAWTLFAESEKKGDVLKRGRFNFGEKLVIAVCEDAEIITKTGGVRFNAAGRHTLRERTKSGSVFRARIRMTRAEFEEVCGSVHRLIPPATIITRFNGETLLQRLPMATTEAVLPTEVADENGYLRRLKRKAVLRLYEPLHGEPAALYEMGIPVQETGDKYHVDIQQKVPVNLERDGVSPSYLRSVRTAALNVLYNELQPDEAAEPWVRDAMASGQITSGAVQRVMDVRFGVQRVIYDPSDKEANHIAVSKGMAVVQGGALTKEEWENVRKYEAALPAGQVTPSPKPFHPDGEPLHLIDREDWSRALRAAVNYFQHMSLRLIGETLTVDVTGDVHWRFKAAYGKDPLTGHGGHLTFNYGLMKTAVEAYDRQTLTTLLIHELVHHKVSNHLSEEFHRGCCELGAKMVEVALERPDLFNLEA